ncbi:MAG: S8 family serine peptidase [Chloroflexi bacterium]|nr:S8 family serine peptidase [Chloroflexota bacterium]
MATKPTMQQFIILPAQGMRSFVRADTGESGRFLVNMAHHHMTATSKDVFSLGPQPELGLTVLDSIHEDGAKLVEANAGSIAALRRAQPGLRLVPLVFYRPALAPHLTVLSGPKISAAALGVKIKVTIVSRKNGSPVPGATVVAFTDFAQRVGAQGVTNSQGVVTLAFGSATKKIERLYIYPATGYWPALKKNVTLTNGMHIPVIPVDLAYRDALRYFYGNAADTAGAGITVGVIDTGVAAHPDLTIAGGANTVVGENPNDYGDNGEGHGTHVAGIIAAHGVPPAGIRGVAPGVTLRSYRVFGQGSGQASNYAIAKAIDTAVSDGCDLLNMSLGGGPADDATKGAIADARGGGCLVIVAAGNDGRQKVSFPASDSAVIAISALGRKGTYPSATTETDEAMPPYGKDKKNFIAAFSNIGPEIDLTAPGVGIISTFPGGYAVLDGTSMACPAATGIAASLLGARADILSLARDQARSDAMAAAVLQAAKTLGFGPIYEGQGLAP